MLKIVITRKTMTELILSSKKAKKSAYSKNQKLLDIHPSIALSLPHCPRLMKFAIENQHVRV